MGWKDDMLRAAADVAFKGAYSGPGYTIDVEFSEDESHDYTFGNPTIRTTYATITVYRGPKPDDPCDWSNVVTSRRYDNDEIQELWLGIMNHDPADYTDGF
ncbi:hypothetical protein [Aeromicrobium sp. 179-A 4D2 NHS]|uniref:hypothetical protein n=1 Tax=Aeromicrobium sp. 179-A 4D2 NHS TaxID=3142375 RepID=UPI00399F51D5